MTSFAKLGFVAEEARQFSTKLEAAYGVLWQEANAVNEFAQALQYKLVIHKESLEEIITAVLYARTLSTYQAFLLVSERGMEQQVKMLMRCMLESLFPLVAISEDRSFVKILVLSEEAERLKGLNKLIRYWERAGDPDGELASAKKLAMEVREQVNKSGSKRLSIVESAEKSGLLDWYDTVYSLLSNTVHASVRSLEEHLHISTDGALEALKNEPSLEDQDKMLVTGMESMFHATQAVGRIFSIGVDEFVQGTSKRIREVYKPSVSKA